MQTLADIKALLATRGLAPRRSLGQNFLIDKNAIGKFVQTALDGMPRRVLEVGPGTGALTEALLGAGCRVVAVELDRGLAGLLSERSAELVAAGGPGASLEVIEGDCLHGPGGRAVNPEALAALARGVSVAEPFTLIANLPYNAATPLMLALLMDQPACVRLSVTIQREVAERLVAQPGTPEYGTLGIVAGAMAEVRRVAELPPECFWPRPEVTSSMVVLDRRVEPMTNDPQGLARFGQRLFSARRKQLGAILGRDRPWPGGIDPKQRPGELTISQVIALMESSRTESGEAAVDESDRPG